MDRKRIQKLLELRQKELDKKVQALSLARAAVDAAERAVQTASEGLRLAALERVRINRAGADWQMWVTTQDWMSQQAQHFAHTQQLKAHSDRLCERALGQVHKARSDVLRIEALLVRIDAEIRAKAVRTERRTEDEFQANRSGARQVAGR